MVESTETKNPNHSLDIIQQQGASKCFDDDGRLKRKGKILN